MNLWIIMVYHLHHENQFVYSSQFSFPFWSTNDVTFYEQLSRCFQKSRGGLITLLVHLVYSPSFQWRPCCSFSYASLYVLFWLFHLLYFVYLFFSLSIHCPWNMLFLIGSHDFPFLINCSRNFDENLQERASCAYVHEYNYCQRIPEGDNPT